MLSLLFAICSSSSPALIPPFQVDIDGNVDDWIFSGFSLVKSNEIVLAPPLPGHRGGAWLSTPLLSKPFTHEVALTLSCFASGGAFGVWLAAHFGSDGEICGGPRSFRGIAVLGRVVVDENRTQYIQLTALPGNNDDLASVTATPFAVFPVLHDEVNLTIRVSSKDGRSFVVVARTTPKWGGKTEILHSNPPNQFFLGITAQNLKFFTKTALRSVRFSNATTFNEEDAVYTKLNPDPHVSFPQTGRLQSHRFELVEEEMGRISDAIPESNFSQLLRVIDELNGAAYDVASFKELNRFLQYSLQPYAEKWQRRSIKVILYTVFMSNSVSKLLERNKALFRKFNTSAELVTSRSRQNMEDLAKVIQDAADQSNAEYDFFVEEMTAHVVAKGLIIGAVIEVLVVFALFVFLQFADRKKTKPSK
jgi:hypothetical protein